MLIDKTIINQIGGLFMRPRKGYFGVHIPIVRLQDKYLTC